MKMTHIYTAISSFVSSDYSLVKYSVLTQGLIGSSTTILWNDTVSNVNQDIYNEFKDALKLRGSKFYTHNQVLPYPDFCIALLSCNGYSLNHLSTPNIPVRTYIDAWRSLFVIASTGESSVKEWLNKYIVGRTASGFCSIHGIQLHNSPVASRTGSIVGIRPQTLEDESILDKAINSMKIVQIPYGSIENVNMGVSKSTLTPECQLGDLRIFHEIMYSDS